MQRLLRAHPLGDILIDDHGPDNHSVRIADRCRRILDGALPIAHIEVDQLIQTGMSLRKSPRRSPLRRGDSLSGAMPVATAARPALRSRDDDAAAPDLLGCIID